jgi:hypothetical protein
MSLPITVKLQRDILVSGQIVRDGSGDTQSVEMPLSLMNGLRITAEPTRSTGILVSKPIIG